MCNRWRGVRSPSFAVEFERWGRLQFEKSRPWWSNGVNLVVSSVSTAARLSATLPWVSPMAPAADGKSTYAFGKLSNENDVLVRVLHISESLSNFFPRTFVAELSRQVCHRFAIARLSGTNRTHRMRRHDIGLLFHPSKLLDSVLHVTIAASSNAPAPRAD